MGNVERGKWKVGKVGKGWLEGGKGGERVAEKWGKGDWKVGKVGKGWLEGG